MTMQKNILTSALATVSVMCLAACSGDSKGTQDVGSGSNAPAGVSSRVLSARAVDGYLAAATVYVDQNENGELDAFEPRALTDNDGFFSYNHRTDTDYCAVDAAPALAKYCLRANIAADAEVLIRVAGGYDTITGVPFKGALSLRSSKLDSKELRLVTPQTSMVADAGLTTQEKLQALTQAGLLDGSLDDDHIGDLLGGQGTRAQLVTQLVRLFGEAAEVTTGHAFEDVRTDIWYSGYVAVASKMIDAQLSGGSGRFDEMFSSSGASLELLRSMVHSQLYPGQTMPAGYTLPYEAAADSLLQSMTELTALSEQLATVLQNEVTISPEHLTAVQRLQTLVTERISTDPADPELADLLAWAHNQLGQGNGLGTDLTALGDADIDLSALIEPSFDFDPASNSISASAKIPAEAASAFASLVNTGFGVNVNRGDEQGAALIFIGGESGARSGKLDVCIRYRDSDGDFDTGSSSDLDGAMLVKGDWSLLNDHTLILSLDVMGGVRSLLLKSVGVDGLDRQYRFDFGGDLSEWSGSAPTGFGVGSVPADDAQCRTALLDKYGSVSGF